MNIISFEEYVLMNEGTILNKFGKLSKNLLYYALIYFLYFNGLDDSRKMTLTEIKDYIKTFDIKNNDKDVVEALNFVKDKIKNDDRIENKEEILNKLDSLSIVRRKSDKISRAMYKFASSGGGGIASSFAIPMKKKDFGYDCNMIFLADDASKNEIVHEISHIVDSYIIRDSDFDMTRPFDFTRSYVDQAAWSMFITNKDAQFGHDDEKVIKYLSSNTEIYSRLNSLKYFLYKRKYIKTPNEKISREVFKNIMTGEFYKKLSEEDKNLFIESDFMDILIFIDIYKIGYINQYVDLIGKELNLA